MLSSKQQQGDQSVVTRILLVDDDPHLVPLIQRGLAYEGFEVYTAMDG
jgi:two-component system, OmpR family, response regulator MprA